MHMTNKAYDTTVLVVEDQPEITQIIKLILKKEIYSVLMANTAEEAIKITEAHKKNISMVISDIILPGMNGVKLSQELQKKDPDMKFLFMSGYSDEVLEQYGNFSKNSNFISKPFSFAHFANMVHNILSTK